MEKRRGESSIQYIRVGGAGICDGERAKIRQSISVPRISARLRNQRRARKHNSRDSSSSVILPSEKQRR